MTLLSGELIPAPAGRYDGGVSLSSRLKNEDIDKYGQHENSFMV